MGHSCDKHASGFIFLPLFSLLVANRITSHITVHILFHSIVVSFNDTCMTIATDLHMSTEICAHVPNEQSKSITIWHTAACKMLSIIHQTESASRKQVVSMQSSLLSSDLATYFFSLAQSDVLLFSSRSTLGRFSLIIIMIVVILGKTKQKKHSLSFRAESICEFITVSYIHVSVQWLFAIFDYVKASNERREREGTMRIRN